MKLYEWIPKKTNQTAQTVIILLLVAAAILFAFPMVLPDLPFRWGVQLLALGLLTAAIFMVTRYVAKFYIYRIVSDGDDANDLTVTESRANGKGQVTVCRVGLAHILRRELVESNERVAQERKGKKGKIFDYRVDFHPAQSILLTVEEGGEELTLLLSYSEELWAWLTPSASRGEEDGQ